MTEFERLTGIINEVARMANRILKAIKRVQGYGEEKEQEAYEAAKEIAATALSMIDPYKPYGTKLFDAIAQVSISTAIEAVVLRQGKDGLEVFMTQRPETDTAYPGEWHCPGSVLRPGENLPDDVLARLAKSEFLAEIKGTKFVGDINHPEEARGHFISKVYLIQQEEAGSRGVWFPVDHLPEKTVDSHRDKIIPLAVSKYSE